MNKVARFPQNPFSWCKRTCKVCVQHLPGHINGTTTCYYCTKAKSYHWNPWSCNWIKLNILFYRYNVRLCCFVLHWALLLYIRQTSPLLNSHQKVVPRALQFAETVSGHVLDTDFSVPSSLTDTKHGEFYPDKGSFWNRCYFIFRPHQEAVGGTDLKLLYSNLPLPHGCSILNVSC